MLLVFLDSSSTLLFRNMSTFNAEFNEKKQRITASGLAVSLWFFTRIFFPKLNHRNRCNVLRYITFTKNIFLDLAQKKKRIPASEIFTIVSRCSKVFGKYVYS